MRKFTTILFAAATIMLLSAALFAPVAFAQDAGTMPTRVGVADVQAIMTTSKAGKSIQAQISKQQESLKSEFSKLEKDLAEAQKKMTESKDAKPEEAAAKQKEFEGKLKDANRLVQDRRQALEKGAGEAMATLRREVVKVVAKIAEEEKYTLVVSSQNVIVSQESMDITEKVLKQLDKDFPDVKVQIDAPADAAPAKKK